MPSKVVKELINPHSIVIVGGSNNIHKPGGKLIKNLKDGNFAGELLVVNPKEEEVQGVPSFRSVEDLPDVDLAILAIPASFCSKTVRTLANTKNTKAFIIVSAGFSEESEAGKELEKEIVEVVESAGGSLIGPNCIGVMTPYYQGVFTLPIPPLSPDGCDFISGSGATAVFIMESGIPKGLRFASVFSVGNSAQLGVEDMLEYMDESFDPARSSKNKILYIESINKPSKLLKHAASLIGKGCRIAAIKAGSSEAGSRAASSHTGAMASSDQAVNALFRKAGMVRCYGREELSTVAGIFNHPEINGRNAAIITHAGGPAVMLTDVLSRGGFSVPSLEGSSADELREHLFPGSSVTNPIDILATGTAEQVEMCIDYCEKKFDEIDFTVIIFGSSGLTEVFDVYDVIHRKMQVCRKPIFAVMPSISTAGREVQWYRDKGHIVFYDEVILGESIVKVTNTPSPATIKFSEILNVRKQALQIIGNVSDHYLPEEKVFRLLDLFNIPAVTFSIIRNEDSLKKNSQDLPYPVAMKVIGPVHKSDVGGVVLNLQDFKELEKAFIRLREIEGFEGVLIQPMVEGLELFIGAAYEKNFGHMIYCGLGGIFVEAIKDISSGLVPLNKDETLAMIESLRSKTILKGIRGEEGVDTGIFADIIVKVSRLLLAVPEIREMDLNPLIGTREKIMAVDARIRL